jgi:hypothetical protein
MMSKNQGYGISGARNVYTNSTTRVGNWVEDNTGAVLAIYRKDGDRFFETEYSAQNKPIPERPRIPEGNFKVPSVQDLKAKNKDGLPYVTIFKHGKSDMPPNERFTTMLQTSSSTNLLETFARPEGALKKEKDKITQQDILAARDKTTESRFANGHILTVKPNSIPQVAIGRSENLPVWGRKHLLQ